MFKTIFFVLSLALTSVAGFSQTNQQTTLAPFEVTLVNGQKYKSFQLKKGEPVMLMYFSPECDHCRDLTKEILKNIKSLGNKQLTMITYFPETEVKKFVNDLGLQKYPNIKVGTEGMSLIVQKHYNIRNFPFIALYDKTGKMNKIFREQAPAAEIVKAMAAL